MFESQLAWYIGGPLLGLCVVAMRWLLNERLGATGAWVDVVEQVSARRAALGPRGWMLVGLILGGLLYAVAAGGSGFEGYGWLTETFSGTGGAIAIALILFVGGALIGFGAMTAGGCTSGNGLSGNAMASRASLVATMTFFVTAIVVTVAIDAVI